MLMGLCGLHCDSLCAEDFRVNLAKRVPQGGAGKQGRKVVAPALTPQQRGDRRKAQAAGRAQDQLVGQGETFVVAEHVASVVSGKYSGRN